MPRYLAALIVILIGIALGALATAAVQRVHNLIAKAHESQLGNQTNLQKEFAPETPDY